MKDRSLYKLVALVVFFGFVVSFPAGASILSVENLSYSLGNHRGDILYVGGGGSGNYTKIQDAIDNASDGDTVYVYDDSSPYCERPVIDKPLSLIGEDKESTVIDGEDEGTVLKIHAVDGCLVRGFTIQNCKGAGNAWDFAVVWIYNSENVTVEDNIISIGYRELKDWVACVDLLGSKYCTIRNNHLSEEEHQGRTVGVALRTGSSHNTVSGNNISTYVEGIDLSSTSDNNSISGNYLHHNSWGIDCSGKYHYITNNTIQYNTCVGIDGVDVHHSTISGNHISHNGAGGEFKGGIILCFDSSDNVISDNVIAYNNPTGLYVLDCHGNVIERNNFIDNKGSKGEIYEGNVYFIYFGFIEFFTYGGNTWRGNYWSDSLTHGLLPKAIFGEIAGAFLLHYWFEIDWRPAIEPYDIPYYPL